MPDDFFRLRLVCVLLDTCGMCFDRGSQKRKLDNWLVFFQVCLTLTYYWVCGRRPTMTSVLHPMQRTMADGFRVYGYRFAGGHSAQVGDDQEHRGGGECG